MTHRRQYPIAVALDGPWSEVKVWAERLKDKVWGFKVGSILYADRGPQLVDDLKSKGFNVFLDLKFHDIPNTVQLAVRGAFAHGADLLTVHACGGRAMLEAAASEQKGDQKILAVTVLTSLDQSDLHSIGVQNELPDQVVNLGKLAVDSGIKGLVCSPKEVGLLREKFPQTFLLTPGVRFQAGGDDQKRTETIASAFDKGASMVVLGRALTKAEKWEEAWKKVTSSMEKMY